MTKFLQPSLQNPIIDRTIVKQGALTVARHIGTGGDVIFFEHAGQVAKGEADDVGITSIQRGNGAKARMLDGVGTCFIEGIAGCDVGKNFFVGVVSHGDGRHANLGDRFSTAMQEDGYGGVDLVSAPTQMLEHFHGFCGIARFPHDGQAIDDGGICRDCHAVRTEGVCGGQGFHCGEAGDVGVRIFTGEGGFIHIHRVHMEHPAPQREQLPSAGGIGGKGENNFVGQGKLVELEEFVKIQRNLVIILSEKVFSSVRGTLQ